MCLASTGRILAIRWERPADQGPEQGDDLWRVALVDFEGVRTWVSLACLPQARHGDRVVVHVGLAIAIESEANEREPIESAPIGSAPTESGR